MIHHLAAVFLFEDINSGHRAMFFDVGSVTVDCSVKTVIKMFRDCSKNMNVIRDLRKARARNFFS